MRRQNDIFGVIALGILASLRLYFLYKAAALFKTMNMEVWSLMISAGWWFCIFIAFVWICFDAVGVKYKIKNTNSKFYIASNVIYISRMRENQSVIV